MAVGKYKKWLTPEGLIRIEGWARDGLTDEQIAEKMQINVATLYRWKNDHCEICEALKRGKDVIDRQVENALLRRALGYEYNEVRTKNECGIVTERVVIKKEVAPDVTAQIFWLKNRKPDKWRDKPDVENGDVENANIQSFLRAIKPSTEDLKNLFQEEEEENNAEETKKTGTV